MTVRGRCGCGHGHGGRLLVILSVLLLSAVAAVAHNITTLLSSRPEFASFNNYLSLTHLSYDINSRNTITVLALDNAAMTTLLTLNPTIATVKNILSLHVLLDYFDSKKLHQLPNGTSLAATIFQATGLAPGMSGFVNMTDLAGSKVGFKPQDGGGDFAVFFVKSLVENPYNISVVQISGAIPSAEASAPLPDPTPVNMTDVMAQKGCGTFARILLDTPDAMATYTSKIVGGLTVFCPEEDPFMRFMPKFKNLTVASRISFLEFYGVQIYQSLSMLRSNSGPTNTLATSGPGNFVFNVQNAGQDITLKTKVNTVKITGTLLDQQPVAIYSLDGVLLPQELFTPAPVPPPVLAPSPAPAALPPKSQSPPTPPQDSEPPADSPQGDTNDQTPPNKSLGAKAYRECMVMSLISLALLVMS